MTETTTRKPPAAIRRRLLKRFERVDSLEPDATAAAPEYAALICELIDGLEKIAKNHAGIINTENGNAPPASYYALKIRSANLAAPVALRKCNDDHRERPRPESEKRIVFSWKDPQGKENAFDFTITLKYHEKAGETT